MNSLHPVSERRLQVMMLFAVVLPVLMATLLSLFITRDKPEPFTRVVLEPLLVSSADELGAIFNHHEYDWPPKTVPAIAVRSLPSGLDELPVHEKKKLFFQLLLPLVLAENAQLEAERRWIERQLRGEGEPDMARVQELVDEYGIKESKEYGELLERLLKKVDTVPTGLVLAQAANESGWGTSRFSREANNLFGEWTWDADKGVLPRQRPEGATHFVRRFASLRESVRSYLHNINSGSAYEKLRLMRASLRQQGKRLDPLLLATGLERYSARGQAYVEEVQVMIRSNDLNNLGRLDLVH